MIVGKKNYLLVDEFDIHSRQKNYIRRLKQQRINTIIEEFTKLISLPPSAPSQQGELAATSTRESIYKLVDELSIASRQIGLSSEYVDKIILDGKLNLERNKKLNRISNQNSINRKFSNTLLTKQNWEEFYEDVMKSISIIEK